CHTTPSAARKFEPRRRRLTIALGDRCAALAKGATRADAFLASALSFFTATLAGIVCWRQGLHLPLAEVCPPLGLVLLLVAAARYYASRQERSFVLCLTTLAQIVAFAAGYIVLMYALASLAWPLVDSRLAAFDAWCGLTAPSARHWAEAHPAWQTALDVAYGTLLYQTALAVAVLGLANDRRRLSGFVLAFMVAALTAAGLFVVLPAEGPFARFGFEPTPDQATFLEHFRSLRDGARTVVPLRANEGLITFPSFHVAWAILLCWAFRGRRLLFAAVVVLNALVVASTMTTGWHYFADVLGGAVVALAAICTYQLIGRKRTE
ncbi:MAG: phosphatase PAP2 family protein, partial [Pirellulales bacterium]